VRLPRPRLAARLLLFNLLLVFLPVAGLLSLDTLERRLLERQEQGLAAQARLVAAALGESGELVEEEVRLLLRAAAAADGPRFQVLDRHAHLLADSAALGGPASGLEPAPPLAGPAVQTALAGLPDGGRLPVTGVVLTLFRMAPVRSGSDIVAVVSASQGTGPTRAEVAALRRSIWKVFAAALAGSAFLTLYFARTLARPLGRLTRESADMLDPRGQVRNSFSDVERGDEIGDLARALEEHGRRLRSHLGQAEAAASDLSHEFRNPLASIRGAAEVMADVDGRDERHRFLATIEREIARLQALLRAVRQSAALESQLLSEERQPVALRALVVELATAAAARSGLPVEVEGADGVAVMAVRERLQQVLDNLLDNAISFSPPGAAVSVLLEAGAETVLLTVRDRGPGVPPEHAERIFDRFFSYRPQQSGATAHTGLGLAIARSIVRAYGGEMRTRNHPRGGALFEVELPLAGVGELALRGH
jgi:two-component system sensor histidine kinase ChvG